MATPSLSPRLSVAKDTISEDNSISSRREDKYLGQHDVQQPGRERGSAELAEAALFFVDITTPYSNAHRKSCLVTSRGEQRLTTSDGPARLDSKQSRT